MRWVRCKNSPAVTINQRSPKSSALSVSLSVGKGKANALRLSRIRAEDSATNVHGLSVVNRENGEFVMGVDKKYPTVVLLQLAIEACSSAVSPGARAVWVSDMVCSGSHRRRVAQTEKMKLTTDSSNLCIISAPQPRQAAVKQNNLGRCQHRFMFNARTTTFHRSGGLLDPRLTG